MQFDIPGFVYPASEALRRGCGQVITKSILAMALCRACGIPARARIVDTDMTLPKDLMDPLSYASMTRLAPRGIVPHIVRPGRPAAS